MRAKEALFHPPDVFPGMEKPLFCVFFRARVKNTSAAKKTTKVVALKRAAAAVVILDEAPEGQEGLVSACEEGTCDKKSLKSRQVNIVNEKQKE